MGFSLKIPEFPMEIITIFPSQKGHKFDAWLFFPTNQKADHLPTGEWLFGPLLNR